MLLLPNVFEEEIEYTFLLSSILESMYLISALVRNLNAGPRMNLNFHRIIGILSPGCRVSFSWFYLDNVGRHQVL